MKNLIQQKFQVDFSPVLSFLPLSLRPSWQCWRKIYHCGMFYLGRRHTSPDDYAPQSCTAHTECVYSPGSNNGRSRERTTKGNGTVLLVNSNSQNMLLFTAKVLDIYRYLLLQICLLIWTHTLAKTSNFVWNYYWHHNDYPLTHLSFSNCKYKNMVMYIILYS